MAAVITGPVVVVLQKLRKENTTQHAESRGLLEHLVVKIDKVDDKIDRLEDRFETHINQPNKEKL